VIREWPIAWGADRIPCRGAKKEPDFSIIFAFLLKISMLRLTFRAE